MSEADPERALHRDQRERPFVIGVIGLIASGKSSVTQMLAHRGAHVIDADLVYRSLLKPGSGLYQSIVDRFGAGVVAADGAIDRAALGAIVFDDPEALSDLDAIAHPAVVAAIREELRNVAEFVVVIEAVKLAQSGLLSDVDVLWEVVASPEVRLRRLMNRSGLSETAARARIQAHTDAVPASVPVQARIDNSGTRQDTEVQLRQAWQDHYLPTSVPTAGGTLTVNREAM